MEEVWKACVQAPNYEVSNLGNVRRGVPGKGTYVGRPLKTRPWRGYRIVKLNLGMSKVVLVLVHKLVLQAFVGLPDGKITRHLDGNGENNCLSNLRYGTPAENVQDALRHGTHRCLYELPTGPYTR